METNLISDAITMMGAATYQGEVKRLYKAAGGKRAKNVELDRAYTKRIAAIKGPGLSADEKAINGIIETLNLAKSYSRSRNLRYRRNCLNSAAGQIVELNNQQS